MAWLQFVNFPTQNKCFKRGLRIHFLDDLKMRIANRAIEYVEALKDKTGMEHLDRAQKVEIRHLVKGVTVSRLLTEHDADVLAATLHDEMPWLGYQRQKRPFLALSFFQYRPYYWNVRPSKGMGGVVFVCFRCGSGPCLGRHF